MDYKLYSNYWSPTLDGKPHGRLNDEKEKGYLWNLKNIIWKISPRKKNTSILIKSPCLWYLHKYLQICLWVAGILPQKWRLGSKLLYQKELVNWTYQYRYSLGCPVPVRDTTRTKFKSFHLHQTHSVWPEEDFHGKLGRRAQLILLFGVKTKDLRVFVHPQFPWKSNKLLEIVIFGNFWKGLFQDKEVCFCFRRASIARGAF